MQFERYFSLFYGSLDYDREDVLAVWYLYQMVTQNKKSKKNRKKFFGFFWHDKYSQIWNFQGCLGSHSSVYQQMSWTDKMASAPMSDLPSNINGMTGGI